MKKIPFVKYTCYGNNFVIVDDTLTQNFTESEMSQFAHEATNSQFGIGSDNLLVVQRLDEATLSAIQRERGYWEVLPDTGDAEFVFRMFEPDGGEAFSCGNGLMCVAHYLNHQYGILSTRIITEVPFPNPRVITIGSTGSASWARLGKPRRVPQGLAHPQVRESVDGVLDFVTDLEVHFRSHDLAPYTDAQVLRISGFLVFTGEPHLVIFPDQGFSEAGLIDTVFDYRTKVRDPRKGYRRVNFGSWLVNRIGAYVNSHYPDQFPVGLNINFARVHEEAGVVEYRCFERGINRETLACGTGALAVAYLAQHLGLIKGEKISVLPHQCRRYQPKAEIKLQDDESDWLLNGHPLMLVDGTFMLNSSRRTSDTLVKLEVPTQKKTVVSRGRKEHGCSAAASS